MAYEWTVYFCFFLALWSALIGGVFSAFSEFVMAGLLRAKPAGGIEVMQHINRTVMKTQFVAGIILIAVFSILFALYANANIEGYARVNIILAAVIYVPSVFLMTMFGNVPMNNKLDRLDHTSAEAALYWEKYGRDWTRLNHVRAIGCALTAIIYIIGAVQLITNFQA